MLRITPRPVEVAPGGIAVFESRHGPGFAMEMGVWDFDKLCFLRQGPSTLVTAAGQIGLGRGQAMLVPAGLPHRFEDDPAHPATLVFVCLRPATLDAVPGQAAGYARLRDAMGVCRPLDTGQSHRTGEIGTCLRRMIFEQTTARPGHDAAIWGLFLQLAVMLARTADEAGAAGPGDRAFARTLDFIDETYTEPVRIAHLAAMAGVSYRHYTTLFRQARGMTVNAYITALRLEFAKKRLLETGNIAFSGLDAGFGDLSNFYRLFRKATGLTPGDYIARHAARAAETK